MTAIPKSQAPLATETPIPHDPLAAWQTLLTEAQDRPALLRLMTRRGSELLKRFIDQYQALLALSRQRRRALLRQMGMGLAGAALLLAFGSTPAFAAAITVDGTTCTLIEAIQNANDTSTGDLSNGCATGDPSGADTITLLGDVTLTAVHNFSPTRGSNGLPTITSPITIEGAGFTISRDGFAPQFRLIGVEATGDLTLNQVTLTGGYAPDEGVSQLGGWGGGLFIDPSGKTTITNSTITGNGAYQWGGGIQNYGTLIVSNSTFSNNTAVTEDGGALSNSGAATISNSTISGNTAGDEGGGLYTEIGDLSGIGTLEVINSTISGNSAYQYGGGLFVDDGSATVTNSTISGNHATASDSYGGGIYVSSDTLTIQGSIVSGNTATYAAELYNGDTVFSNNNLFGHSGEDAYAAFHDTFTPDASDINATSDGTTPTVLSSILDTTLANNGTQPHPFSHALVSGSPAIDAISPSVPGRGPVAALSCVAGTSTDQRGGARAGGINRGGSACDIGAFEYGSTQTPTAITLAGFSAASSSTGGWTRFLAAGLTLLAGLAFWRRKRGVSGGRMAATAQPSTASRLPLPAAQVAAISGRRPYAPPAILHELALETRAGSPLGVNPLNDLFGTDSQ